MVTFSVRQARALVAAIAAVALGMSAWLIAAPHRACLASEVYDVPRNVEGYPTAREAFQARAANAGDLRDEGLKRAARALASAAGDRRDVGVYEATEFGALVASANLYRVPSGGLVLTGMTYSPTEGRCYRRKVPLASRDANPAREEGG